MPGSTHNLVIATRLLAQKTEDSSHLGTAQCPLPDTVERQPLLVEFDSRRQDFTDRLVQGCADRPANFQLRHLGILILLPIVVLTAAIIAGGRGRRLGGLNKSDLVIGGRRIIDRQLDVLGHVAEHILVVSNDHHRFRCSGLQVCDDLVCDAGPLSGVHTALVRSPTVRTMVIACDLPFLTARFLRHLAARKTDADAVIPRNFIGRQPLCAVYSRTCLEPIRRMIALGDFRVSGLGDAVCVTELEPKEVASYDPDGMLLFNVNTPCDYTRAIDRLTPKQSLASLERRNESPRHP